MTRKLYNLVAMLSIVVMLAVVGLLAAAAVSGKLSAPYLDRIAKVLRDEPLTEPPTTAPAEAATQPVVAAAEQNTRNAAAVELANLRLDRRAQELEGQIQQLRNLLQQTQAERDQLRQARLRLQDEILAARRQTEDSGFQKTLRLFETMQAGQVKDLLMAMDPQLGAAYLGAMSGYAAKKVSEQFRTPQERVRLQELLNLGDPVAVGPAGR